jgi:hypothetical protein
MHSVLSDFFHGPVSAEEKRKRVLARITSERRQFHDMDIRHLNLR